MLHQATPGKRGSLCVTSSVGSLNYARPLYAGNKTAAEQQKGFENSMRQYDHDKKRSEKKGRKASVDNALSPMLMKSSSNKDGRPSIGTITQQWEFMRTNFVNNSDEELEWLMVSKKPGAYKYAHKKNSLAEDKYFKALYDIDKMERRFKGLTKLNGTIIQLVSEISAHYTTLASNKSDQQALTSIEETQNTMKTFVEKNIEKEQTPLSFYSSKTEEGLQALISNPDKFKAARKARELSSIIPGELSTVKNSLALAQREADDALKNMEKWAKRETEAEEYQAVLLEEENMWMEKERAKNMEALASMRSFVPINISELSVHDLMENAKAQGGLMTIELAAELKNNKLLHWLVTHPDDIAKSNFLSGDKKSYFENLESLDIVELRAISVVLPKKFELDVDGKKAEWRSRFMTRVKQLVAQQNGDKVKGPWDENSRKRLMIDLPPLKGEQNRRSLYYYRSIEQIDQRLKQFDEKLELLAKKKTWLEKAEKEFSDAKKEYDIILIEMRDPDFRQLYGAEQLATVKELAKKEYLEADKNRKSLLSTVLQLQKSIDTSPITRDQYIAMKNELADFLSENGHLDWAMPNQSPIAIEGVFDPCPEIVKIERFAAKFVSAEEEAEKRKQELLMLTKKEEPIDIIVSEPLMEETVSSFLIKEDLANVDDPLAMTTGSLCCSNPQSLTARYLASASTDHNDQSEVAFAPRTPSRKHSILLSNPDFAATLNNLWSPGPEKVVARAKTPNRRGSIASFAVPKSVQKVEESISGTPKEPKKSQSKLLQVYHLFAPN